MFSCSIAENIAYGALDPESVTADQIMEAAKQANAAKFINGFPEGMNTLVGERGIMLSGKENSMICTSVQFGLLVVVGLRQF